MTKPLLTEFDIHHRLESCVVLRFALIFFAGGLLGTQETQTEEEGAGCDFYRSPGGGTFVKGWQGRRFCPGRVSPSQRLHKADVPSDGPDRGFRGGDRAGGDVEIFGQN